MKINSSLIKPCLTLVAFSGLSLSHAFSQDKPFFSPDYPSSGVAQSQIAPGATSQALAVPRAKNSRYTSTDDPRVNDGRITSSDDNLPTTQQPARQMVHPANLTQWGKDFDQAHPGFYNEPDKAAIQKAYDAAGTAATPAPSSTPVSAPTPVADSTSRRVTIDGQSFNVSSTRAKPVVNQAVQPEAHPTGTPAPLLGAASLGAVQPEAHPTGPSAPSPQPD